MTNEIFIHDLDRDELRALKYALEYNIRKNERLEDELKSNPQKLNA